MQTSFAQYDQMGRLTGWSDLQNNSYTSGYDASGNLNLQSDGIDTSGHPPTLYAYDQLGRIASVTYNYDGTTEQWQYDQSGNVSSYKNRANNTQTFGYDMRNRPTGWSWSDASVTPPSAISFDAAGRCTQMNNSFCVLNMTYDDSNALLTEQECISGHTSYATVGYTLDADGLGSTITYPHGDIAYTPTDFMGRVQNLEFAYGSNPSGFYGMANYGYTNNQLTSRTTGYNVTSSFGYQSNGRVEFVDHHNNSTTISHQTYGYNPNGQLSFYLRTGDSTTNTFNDGSGDSYFYQADGQPYFMFYDAQNVNKTTNFGGDVPASNPPTSPHRGDSISYDGAGNRTYYNINGAATSPTFDGEDRQNAIGYADGNGNTTSASYGGINYTYTYNAYNQLISASGGGNSATFTYDPKGRLVQRTINGTTSNLYYAGDELVEEDNASFQKLRFYLYGAGGERAFRIDSTVYLYLYDARGWLTHVANINSNSIEQYQYDAFGTPEIYNGTGKVYDGQTSAIAGGNRFLWNQGYEWYPEIGLYRCGARFYSPTLGRFMQPDPIGQAGGLNIYAYCHNDAINGSDPDGLDDGDDGSDGGDLSYTGSDPGIFSSPSLPGLPPIFYVPPPSSGGSSSKSGGASNSGSTYSTPVATGGGSSGNPISATPSPASPTQPANSLQSLVQRGIITTGKPGTTEPFGSVDNMMLYQGIPYPSGIYIAESGLAMIAPLGIDYKAVYNQGKLNGDTGAMVGQFGRYDIQRNYPLYGILPNNGNIFFKPYTPVSNYLVGVYGSGTNSSHFTYFLKAYVYAVTNSKNGAAKQTPFQEAGWAAGKAGRPDPILIYIIGLPLIPGVF